MFPAIRDWSRFATLTAEELPTLTPEATRLLDAFTWFCRAQLRLTDPNPHGHTAALRALHIVLAHLGAAAPVHETDLRALARLDANISAQRVIGVLTQLGHLVPAPAVDHDQAVIDRLTATFPEPMRTELQHWVTVLKGEGPRRHRPLPTVTIRGYLGRATPILRMCTEHSTTLTAITHQDIHDVLAHAPGSTARIAHHLLRSLFGALKQQRVIFRDPTRGIHLPANPPLPPLPGDRLAGLLDRAHTPSPAWSSRSPPSTPSCPQRPRLSPYTTPTWLTVACGGSCAPGSPTANAPGLPAPIPISWSAPKPPSTPPAHPSATPSCALPSAAPG